MFKGAETTACTVRTGADYFDPIGQLQTPCSDDCIATILGFCYSGKYLWYFCGDPLGNFLGRHGFFCTRGSTLFDPRLLSDTPCTRLVTPVKTNCG